MSKKYYMIVALKAHFSHTVTQTRTPEEKEFHHFVNFRTRRVREISVETSTQNAALLSSNDLPMLKHKAGVFNLNGYKARILRGDELKQFQHNVMINNQSNISKSQLN